MRSSSMRWSKICNGVWKARAGAKGAGASLLASSGVPPKLEAIDAMRDADFPFPPASVKAGRAGGRALIEIPYDSRERLFGLGLNFKSLEVQRKVRRLHSDHFGGKDDGRTHCPAPFYVSSAGYGVFVDIARYVDVYAGGSCRKERASQSVDRFPCGESSEPWLDVRPGRTVEISFQAPGADVYVFAGPELLDVVRRFNLLCGGGCLPPVWGLGFSHRVMATSTASEAEAEAEDFDRRGFPLDVLGLEPGWHSRSYPNSYEWNPARFPEPEAFAKRLLDKGVRLNLWENPHVAPESELGRRVEPLSGSHRAGWGGLIPDLSLEEAREAFGEFHRERHISIGVGGYKLDECDGYDRWLWPDHAEFPSGRSGEELRQLYGVVYQRALQEAFKKQGRRTYGLARASNAGASSFPFVLYNDCYEHRDFISALCSSSFCGALWTPEARSAKSAEEWLRRIQSSCMSPMALLNAWCDGSKPWSFPEVEDAVREALLLRVRLIPYLYSAFAKYSAEGTPPFRAMALESGFPLGGARSSAPGELDSTENPYAAAAPDDVKDQYMVGPSLLAAPLFAGEPSRKVLLPPGRWFEFHSGAFAGDGFSEIEAEAKPGCPLPLFVRDGAIIPLGEPALRAPSAASKTRLELRRYGSAEGSFDLYDDDGESFAFEKGEFAWLRLRVSRGADGSLSGSVEAPENWSPRLYGAMEWRVMGS